MAGGDLQYYNVNQWIASSHDAYWKHQGFSACGDIKEAVHAAENEEHGMVDAAAPAASSLKAKSSALRTTEVGCNAWSR